MRNGESVCWQYVRDLHCEYKQSPSTERAQNLWSHVLVHCKYGLGISGSLTRSKRTADGSLKLDDIFKENLEVGFKSLEATKTKYHLEDTLLTFTPWTQYALELYDTDNYTLDCLKGLVDHLRRANYLKYEGRRLIAAIGARVFRTHSVCGTETAFVGDDKRMMYSWYQYFLGVGPSSDNLVALMEEQNLIGPGFDGPLVQWIVDKIEAKNATLNLPGVKWWEDYETALDLKRAREVDRVIATIPGITDMMRNVYRTGRYGFPNGWSPNHVKLNIHNDTEFDVNRDICIRYLKDLIPRLTRLGVDTANMSETLGQLREWKCPDDPCPPSLPSAVPFVPPSELRQLPELQNYIATRLL